MNWTLELVVIPVSDVDRAKAFYSENLGFVVDHDTRVGEGIAWPSCPPLDRVFRLP